MKRREACCIVIHDLFMTTTTYILSHSSDNDFIFHRPFSQIASFSTPQCPPFWSATAPSLSCTSPFILSFHVNAAPFVMNDLRRWPFLLRVCPHKKKKIPAYTSEDVRVIVSHGCWHNKLFSWWIKKPTAHFLSEPQTTGNDLDVHATPWVFIIPTLTSMQPLTLLELFLIKTLTSCSDMQN